MGLDKPIGSHSPVLKRKFHFGVSRGEFVNLLLKVKTDQCRSLLVSDFVTSQGRRRKFDWEIFKIEKFHVLHPSYKEAPTGNIADPLIPIDKIPKICPSELSEDSSVWYIVRFPISEKTEVGKYKFTISLDGKGALAVIMNVWKMKMKADQEFHVYAGFNSWFALLGHFGKWQPGEGPLTHSYLDLLKEIHINPFESWTQLPPLQLSNDSTPFLNLESSPNPEDSFMGVYRDYLGSEKINLPNPFMYSDQTDPENYLKAIENTIHHYGWEDRTFMYLYDEPRIEDYPTLIEWGKLIRRFAPSIKTLVTSHYVSILEPYVDIWVPILNQFQTPGYPEPEIYRNLQARGKEVWFYVSCMSHGCDNDVDQKTPDLILDRRSIYIRALAAIAHKYRANALLYWRLNHAYSQFPQRDPWTDLWYFTGNGDGTLFYPGRPGIHGFKNHQPILSLRLLLIEELLHDKWYYDQMENAPPPPPWWPSALNQLVKSPTDWDKNYYHYQELREKIGNHLHSQPLH